MEMSENTSYAALGLKHTATKGEVKKAYRQALELDLPGNQRMAVEAAYRELTRRKPNLPVNRKVRKPPPVVLQDRDREIILAVNEYRLLTTTTIRELFFEGRHISRARERLRLLFHHGYLERSFLPPDNGMGRGKVIYSLGRKGREVVAEDRGCHPEDIKYAKNARRASPWHLRHALAVSDCKRATVKACVAAGATLEKWMEEQELKIDGRADRVPDPHGGEHLKVLADAFLRLRNDRGERFNYFLEVDLCTISHFRWRKRTRGYQEYRKGRFQERFGYRRFRVLVVTKPDYRKRSRSKNLMDTVRKEAGKTDMFLFSTLDKIQDCRVIGPCWKAPNGEVYSLI